MTPRYIVQNLPGTPWPRTWMVVDRLIGLPATANERPQMHLTLDEALDMSAELNIADRQRRTATLQ